jgi:hypothetical protein
MSMSRLHVHVRAVYPSPCFVTRSIL